MMSPTPEDDRDLVAVRGLLRMMDETTSERHKRSRSGCPRLLCGCTIGIALTVFVITATVVLASLFAFSYMSLESGTCPHEWIGLGYSCMRAMGSNATELEALDTCSRHNSKLVDFTHAKILIEAIAPFASTDANSSNVFRLRDSRTTCVRPTAAGPVAVDCPRTCTAICQRPRPLSIVASIIRDARTSLRLERREYYEVYTAILSNGSVK
ncbi:UL45 protein [Gallid alphaherpesvirus 3]|uniref:UL45 protein n=1 Tax=Gallid alphaherpesvirus 3 TaxID=35250 RepID=F8TC43_9ALPH|nr:UL45 protein [Gallid alphaherpesvirus 3]AEI00254.1 UL45 protein [Gallid alphaherpesvirus 3]QEY02279.1 UL45 protein [Gallid alphaherpesvirus 3]